MTTNLLQKEAFYLRLLLARPPLSLSFYVPLVPTSRAYVETSRPRGFSFPFSEDTLNFFTRDMKISLDASTATLIQFGNPLTQLGSNLTPCAGDKWWSNTWHSAHQKLASFHIGCGIGNMDSFVIPARHYKDGAYSPFNMPCLCYL